jgi:hypothetical protein
MLDEPELLLSSCTALGLEPSPDEVWVMVLNCSNHAGVGVGAGPDAGLDGIVGTGADPGAGPDCLLGELSRLFSRSVITSSVVMSPGFLVWSASGVQARELVRITGIGSVGVL